MTDLTATEVYGEAQREKWARTTVGKSGENWDTHLAKFSGAVLPREAPPLTDWSLYRKCSICDAEIGEPCVSQSGFIVGGQPDRVRTELAAPHKARKPRTRKPAGQ